MIADEPAEPTTVFVSSADKQPAELEEQNAEEQKALERLVRHKSVELLSRREHSRWELAAKLRQRQYPVPLIELVLDQLHEKNYQCDMRFALQFAEQRINRGYGRLSVLASLSSKGIDSRLAANAIDEVVNELEIDWVAHAQAVLEARFARDYPSGTFSALPPPGGADDSVPGRPDQAKPDQKERSRHARFLKQRGFPPDQSLMAMDEFYSSMQQ